MAARETRHLFLAHTAARLKIRSIALAHHADDQVELFLLRLLRGSGGEGLGGMKWKNASPARTRRNESRIGAAVAGPDKGSAAKLCRGGAEIHFREDASNASVDILRNRVRHELLPLLRRKYPTGSGPGGRPIDGSGARRSGVCGCGGAKSGGEGERRTKASFHNLTEGFEQLPVAVQRRVLQLELREKKIDADFALVEQLRTLPGQPVSIAPRTSVLRGRNGEVHLPPGYCHGTKPGAVENQNQRAEGKHSLRRKGDSMESREAKDLATANTATWPGEFRRRKGGRRSDIAALAAGRSISADRHGASGEIAGFLHKSANSPRNTARINCGHNGAK